MLIDLTLAITPQMIQKVEEQALSRNFGDGAKAEAMKKELLRHCGTHLDTMKKHFPLDYVERKALVFDVSQIRERDIDVGDIDFLKIKKEMCIAFHTAYIEETGYGNPAYFLEHPQLSNDLIDKLLDYKISLIALDCAAVRRGKEHMLKDQLCADNHVFVIENICNLKTLLDGQKSREFIANTYPANYTDVTGLPCRMVAKV